MGRPTIVCLLPARNAAADLPAWFASVERFADVVLALDDGSTDDTGAVLEAHPLTFRLLRNPRRETYHGWDDAANRNRLLKAAGELAPRWIISLDSDERIDSWDAAALRAAAEGQADPSCGYFFRTHRMIGRNGQWDRANLWVGRMFAWRPGQRFPDAALHFVPLPVDLPAERWRKTTIRIQHIASSTENRRRQRFAKYQEADPDRRWQFSYDRLLDPPGELRPWERRPPGLPFVRHGSTPPMEAPDNGTPAVSVVVVSDGDRNRLRDRLDALAAQRCDESFEIVVVVSETDDTARIVRSEYPGVSLVALDRPGPRGSARNAGLAAARGQFVTFPDLQVLPGYIQATLDGHRGGWAMVTGSVENGADTAAGWGNYFLTHHTELPGRLEQALDVPPETASYRRDVLDAVGGFPNVRIGEYAAVNARLWEMGYGCWFNCELRTLHDAPRRSLKRLIHHHADRGEILAVQLRAEHAASRLLTRSGVRRYAVTYVPGRLRAIVRNVRRWGMPRHRRGLIRSFPLVTLAVVVHWASAWIRVLPEAVRRGRDRH